MKTSRLSLADVRRRQALHAFRTAARLDARRDASRAVALAALLAARSRPRFPSAETQPAG